MREVEIGMIMVLGQSGQNKVPKTSSQQKKAEYGGIHPHPSYSIRIKVQASLEKKKQDPSSK
jgi:hypothetical protein